MKPWIRFAPLVGIAIVVAFPLMHYAHKLRAERAAAEFLRRLYVAQDVFRATGAGGHYASDVASLTTPCPGSHAAALPAEAVSALQYVDYVMRLRAAAGSHIQALDCHGRPTVSDYYAAVAPRSAASAGQQAFSIRADGRIFVFFDGLPPLERDMRPGGLATPLESLDAFKIP